jgi:hypothetical protein
MLSWIYVVPLISIQPCMSQSRKYMHLWGALLLVFFLVPGLWAQSEATFQGELDRAVCTENGQRFVEFRDFNEMVRRVVITHAQIQYDALAEYDMPDVPAQEALVPGTDVRINAHMDPQSGEWTASLVVIFPDHALSFENDIADDGDEPAMVSVVDASPNNRRRI